MNADGTWDKIQKFWKSDEAEGAAADMSGLTGESGTLILAVSGNGAPYSYISNGNIAGADPDLAVRFCREYGYGIDIRIVDFGGIIPSRHARSKQLSRSQQGRRYCKVLSVQKGLIIFPCYAIIVLLKRQHIISAKGKHKWKNL